MKTRRREFIATMSAGMLAKAAPAAGYEPILAVQAYVFSQAYGRLEQRLEDHVTEVFEIIAGAGFKTVELTNQFFTPEMTSNHLQSLMLARLKCPVVYIGGAMHTQEDADKTVKEVLALANRVKAIQPFLAINFNANPKPKREAKTDAELGIQAKNITRLARELKRLGLRLFIHQHDPEMAENAREWRHILANTDPKLVEFCLDVHWVYRGGQDPMALLKECAPRLGALHVRNSKNKIWTQDFGDGDIDYNAVAAFLKSQNFRGYIVVELAWDKETEVTKSLEVNMKASREYAEKVFGAKA